MEENEFFFFVVFFLFSYNACKDIEQMNVPNVILGLHATGVVIYPKLYVFCPWQTGHQTAKIENFLRASEKCIPDRWNRSVENHSQDISDSFRNHRDVIIAVISFHSILAEWLCSDSGLLGILYLFSTYIHYKAYISSSAFCSLVKVYHLY